MSRLSTLLDWRLPRGRTWIGGGGARAALGRAAMAARVAWWARGAGRQRTVPFSRVPMEEWRRQVGGRVARSSADLMRGRPRAMATWAPRAPEEVTGHRGLMEDFCVVPSGTRPPRRIAADWSYPGCELRYARLREAMLFTRLGCVAPRAGVFLLETMRSWTSFHAHAPQLARLADGRLALRRDAARPTRRLNGPVMPLCHVHAGNYGHWLTEALAGVPDMLDRLLAGQLRLVTRPLAPWQRRSLDLLGVPGHAIEEVDDDVVLCADLVCQSYDGPGHVANPTAAVRTLFVRLAAAVPRACASAPRFVFLARRHLPSWRRLADEAELEAALAALGFVVLRPDTLSLDQQIAAFASAEIVVGAHGSAMANVGFAPPGCILFDIMADIHAPVWMRRVTHHLGHRYAYVIGRADPATIRPVAEDGLELGVEFVYRVDIGAAVRAVAAAMERCGVGTARAGVA